MKFTFVIPVYNVETYLLDCVSSIISQSFEDYEIILVDDGSPDNCPKICDSLALKYNFIKVIHKENGGSSSARNVGLQEARGEYVIFLDSDDKWIDKNALYLISDLINKYKPDLIAFGVEDYDPNTERKIISRGKYNQELLNSASKEDLIDHLIFTNNFPGAAWMLVVSRHLLNNNEISFKEGVTAEDFDWIVKVFCAANSIKVLDRIVYQYRCVNDGSITSRPRLSGVLGIHNAISNWLSLDFRNYPQSITDYLASVYLQELLNYAGLSKSEKKIAKEYVREVKVILLRSRNIIHKCMYLFLYIFGVNPLSKMIMNLRRIIRR